MSIAAFPTGQATLPRRDARARARLEVLGREIRPAVQAVDRSLPVAGSLGALLPGGGLRRGSVVAVGGSVGAGGTSLVLQLAAAATAVGEWAAFVDPRSTLGGEAAAEAGVSLDLCAFVRRVPPARWATVVAALLDGVALVVATVPPGLHRGDAHRLAARARERAAVLVMIEPPPAAGSRRAAVWPWPAETALRLTAEGSPWPGLLAGSGLLAPRVLRVGVEGHGGTRSGEITPLALAG